MSQRAGETHSSFSPLLSPVQRTSKVKDVLDTSRPLLFAKEDQTVFDVAKIMRDGDIGALPVLSASISYTSPSQSIAKNDVIGIITDRDLVVRSIAEGLSPSETKIGPFATKKEKLQWVGEDDDLGHCAYLMSQHQVRRLLVARGDRFIGMLSLGDLAKGTRDPMLSAQTLRGVSETPQEHTEASGPLPGKSTFHHPESQRNVSLQTK